MLQLIDRLHSKTWACLFVIFLRYLIGGAFVYAGWGKALGGRFMPVGYFTTRQRKAVAHSD